MIWYYYLHENGDLICKKFAPEPGSPAVRAMWRIDTKNRADAWMVILESLALGANIERVIDLAKHWECTVRDLPEYMRRAQPTKLRIDGLYMFLRLHKINPNEWFAWLESHGTNRLNFDTMPGPKE
jgi:hypothetical protein